MKIVYLSNKKNEKKLACKKQAKRATTPEVLEMRLVVGLLRKVD
jgi:hypothetical protein